MRTLLTEIANIESHLLKATAPEDALLFDAQAIIDPLLAQNIAAQKESYRLINLYGRKQLKAELETIHQQLFTEKLHGSFAEAMRRLFFKI